MGEEDSIAIAGMAGETLEELDESLGVGGGLIELVGGVSEPECFGEGEKAVGFVGACEEIRQRTSGQSEAFGVDRGLGFGGQGLGLVGLAGGEFGQGRLTFGGGAVGAGGEGEE
ncbi:MAG: hypothetical protein NTV52_31615 [Acidobacteria bacterium]|nr:hypothetical protein [Acidobacteriota bacterium]